MSSAVGALSATNNGRFSPPLAEDMNKSPLDKQNHLRYLRDDSDEEEDEDEDSKLNQQKKLDLGPQFSLTEQLEKDKDDESLRKWKEQLLGSVDLSKIGEERERWVRTGLAGAF